MRKNAFTCTFPVVFLFIIAFGVRSFSQGSPEKEARDIFQKLIAVPGVSFHEEKVREEIRGLLPKEVKPVVDEMGNLVVVLGSGKPEIMFIAHMDEIGLEVSEISQDGTLKTRVRGDPSPPSGRARLSRSTPKRVSWMALSRPEKVIVIQVQPITLPMIW